MMIVWTKLSAQGIRRATVVVLLTLSCCAGPRALAQEIPAQPRDYVVDLAGVVDKATFAQLNGYLHELEQKTGAQLIVLTIPSTGGEAIRDYGLRTAEKWHLGKKGKDNGALLVIAVQDRKWDVETGYGLEHVLTDQFCGQAAREHLVPNAKRGDYSRGLYDMALALANRVAEEKGVPIAGMPVVRTTTPAQSRGGVRELVSCCPLAGIVLLIVLAGLARSASYRRRGWGYGRTWGGGGIWPWLFVASELSRGRRGGGWGGGWGGSSGFGGGSFGGGGGGSFGGGGASGGW